MGCLFIEKKKIFIVKKNILNFNFDILKQNLNINNSFSSLNLKFNYFHYLGFIGLNHKLIFFKNNKGIIKFIQRITNIIKGFITGFCLILEIIGLGFSVTNNKNVLRFNIGFNHSIFYEFSKNIKICSKRKFLFLYSFSYFELKKVVTDIKNFRKLNIYKLKGIKEKNELYIKKNWKKKVN